MTSDTPRLGRPKDPEKRAAILEAGKRLFPQHGFDGTSMDAIAAAAGVSKLTVYSHFADKGTLFQEVLREKCTEQLPDQLFKVDPEAPIEKQLRDIAQGFFNLIVSPEAMALHRMMCAQPSDTLGRLFWEGGPQILCVHMSQFLAAEVAAGGLDIPDTERAAHQFFCLVKGEPHARLSYGCTKLLGPADIEAHIDSVIALFMRAYGPK